MLSYGVLEQISHLLRDPFMSNKQFWHIQKHAFFPNCIQDMQRFIYLSLDFQYRLLTYLNLSGLFICRLKSMSAIRVSLIARIRQSEQKNRPSIIYSAVNMWQIEHLRKSSKSGKILAYSISQFCSFSILKISSVTLHLLSSTFLLIKNSFSSVIYVSSE